MYTFYCVQIYQEPQVREWVSKGQKVRVKSWLLWGQLKSKAWERKCICTLIQWHWSINTESILWCTGPTRRQLLRIVGCCHNFSHLTYLVITLMVTDTVRIILNNFFKKKLRHSRPLLMKACGGKLIKCFRKACLQFACCFMLFYP